MLPTNDTIRAYFAKLGLDSEIADIYLALHTHGPQTISALARTSRVERTRIYRLIDKLMDSNLIEIESHYRRGIIKAAPIANLRILIHEREQELKNLQDELGLIEQVLARNSLSSPATRVQFYQGPQGIRQMLWNELRAKGEVVGFSNRILEEATGKKYMESWTDEFAKRSLKARLLVDDAFIESWQSQAATIGTNKKVPGMTYHYLPPAAFSLTHLSDIYDDVVGFFQWRDGEVFGVEIYNQQVADCQRQFFELIWAKSRPLDQL